MPRRSFLLALFIGLVILLSVPFVAQRPLIHKVQATTTNFTLYANLYGWNYSKPSGANPTITVTQGDTISFSLIQDTADSYSPHLFLLDLDNTTTTNDCPNPGPDKCSTVITPTQSPAVAPFTVSFAAGTYHYYCIYHSPPYMIGKFVVKASTTPDFTITASPTAIGPINTRVDGTSTITVSPTGGFSGTVTLSASPSPGLNATIYPTSISGASGTAKLSVNSTTAGSYTVTVSGTGASGTHPISVPVTVTGPDFKIALSSSTLTVAPGSSGSVTVTVSSLNGFSGTVSLTSTVSSAGPQVTFNPVSVALSSAGSATSILSVSAMSLGVYSTPVAAGNYNVNVTGTGGSLVHSTTLALTVGSSSGAGALPPVAIIGGGIVAALAIIGVAVYVLRRRPKTKA